MYNCEKNLLHVKQYHSTLSSYQFFQHFPDMCLLFVVKEVYELIAEVYNDSGDVCKPETR